MKFQEVVDTKDMIDALCRSVMCLSIEEIRAVIDEINRTETLMPIIDPTAYRKIMNNIPDHRRQAEAFLRLRTELGKITNEL